MTEDYKKNILDYITNMMNKTSETTEEIFKEQKSIDRDVWIDYIPNRWKNFRYEGMVTPNETTTGLGVLYGGYIDTDNNVYGIITLFDNDFKPVKTIYEYSSGTKLRYIQYMKQAEDGTFYFIDDEAFTYSQNEEVLTSQKRFVMVNNFTAVNQVTNDYQITLRTSYILQGNYANFYCKNMYKNPNSSHYIFFGLGADDTSAIFSYRYLKIFSLKIEVGSANEWKMFANKESSMFGSAIAQFDADDNVSFRCLISSTKASSRTIDCISKTYTGSLATNSIAEFDFSPFIDDHNYKKQSVFLSMDEVYFVQNNQKWGISGIPEDKYIGLYKYNFNTEKLTTIYEKSLGNFDFSNIEAIYIDKCGTDIYIQFNNNISSEKSDYYFQRLINDEWNPILIGTQQNFVYNQRTIFIKSNFNLLQVYLYATNPQPQFWYQYLIKENYNSLNYNGEPYIDYNSMLSKQAEIYSNNSLVFARNLYNKTINENITNSTVVVPNSYLNDINLDSQNLFSETNLELVTNNNTITKNIYETLYLNFINAINVINEDTKVIYSNTASYINKNINTGTQNNCESSAIEKIRINYQSSSVVKNITWTKIDDVHKQTDFALKINEPIINIDFISNDELKTYITIDTSSLEVGNTYKITQKLRIE